jgi:hypothetical protein
LQGSVVRATVCHKSADEWQAQDTQITPATMPLTRLVNAAITPNPSLMEFYDAGGDAVGSLNPDHAKSWGHGNVKFTVHTLAAQTLFASFGPAEFINLDVESINAILFQHLPWTWTELKLVCVEHDGHDKQMEELVKPAGFKRIHRTGENLILAR